MALVSKDQPKRVFPSGEGEIGLRLPFPEMLVRRVRRNRFVQRWHVSIDQQVVMTGIGLVHTGWSDTHALQTKLHVNRVLYRKP